MNILALIAAVAAVICFGEALLRRPHWQTLVAAGLALVTISWIVQLVWTAAQVTTH